MRTRTFVNAAPLGTIQDIDRLLDSLVRGAGSTHPHSDPTARKFPSINVWQDEAAIYIEAELPGVQREDVEVGIEEGRLILSGCRTIELPEGAESIRRERAHGNFERTVALPAEIDIEKVEAGLADGILRVTVPRAAAVLPRKIEVKAAEDRPVPGKPGSES